VSFAAVKAQLIAVQTGKGNDSVSLQYATLGSFYAFLGRGNDTLDTSGGENSVDSFFAYGGGGNDTLLNSPSNSFKQMRLYGTL
jgi:hypothetical protein